MTPQLRAMLTFLEGMTLRPDELTGADLQAVRAAGVSREAIRDAAHVCALFCTIVRIADALQWHVPADWSGSASSLVKFGYRLPPGL